MAVACSSDEEASRRAAPPRPAPPRKSHPLGFSGKTLSGRDFSFDEVLGRKNLVVVLFDATSPKAKLATAVAERLVARRHDYNLAMVGVVVPPGYRVLSARRVPRERPSRAELAALARKFLGQQESTLECVVDPDGEITERYTKAWGISRMDELPAFYPFQCGGSGPPRPVFPRYAAKAADPADYLYRRILRRLGIEVETSVDPLAGHLPKAPDFEVKDTEGKTHRLGDYRGNVLVVVLMARDCPRCKDLLTFLGSCLRDFGREARGQKPWMEVLAICTDTTGAALARLREERGYRFPVCGDPDWTARSAFRYRGAVPDAFVIGPRGRVQFRHRGFTPAEADVLYMELRTLLGIPTTPMLRRGAYSGMRACGVCHRREAVDWSLTRHACAWETLVRLGRESDPKCVRCHVVGHGHSGGFVSQRKTPHLSDVQCESCHGRNGCKAFAGGVMARPVTAETCARCHDAVHSPRFDYTSYRGRILHNRYEKLSRLSRSEREARLRKLCSGAREELFDPEVPYVGSAVCGRCHPTEYQALEGGVHARALEPLTKPAPTDPAVPAHKRGIRGIERAECVRCHVTGYGRPGGFPTNLPARPLTHPLAGVGCEACHGPGKRHVEDPKKPRAIARLGGTCPECNILPICRQCHDDANSPDFDYRQALPRARHPVGEALEK